MTVDDFCKQFNAQPLFETHEEYEEFCTEFSNEIKPRLDENARARFDSMQRAKNDIK